MRSTRIAPLAADHERDQLAPAHRLDGRAQVVEARQPQPVGGVELDLQRVDDLAHERGQVQAQPRDRPELHRVRHLVQRHPVQQLLAVDLQARGGGAEVRADHQQARRAGRVKQRHVVLAEHALGEEAGQAADLGGEERPRERAASGGRAAPMPPPTRAPTRSSTGRIERRFASIHCWRETISGAGSSRHRHQARVGEHARLRVGGDRRQIAVRRGHGAALPADRLGDPPDEVPVDHDTDDGSVASSASPAAVRAATTGECATRSSGAPSGSSKAGERDQPAALAHDQRARPRRRPSARGPSVAMPSRRPAASWQSAKAIEPKIRTR